MKEKCCSRCKTPAEIELKYSGLSLCKKCFLKFFESRVRKTIRLHNLIKSDDRVAVALSGGKDSASVLYILKKISEKIPSLEIFAVTIDEGADSESLKAASSLCFDLGVEHHIFSFKEETGHTLFEIVEKIISPSEENLSRPCTYCGIIRRDILNRKVRELGGTKIATGHNLDDEVQVAMMNFIKSDIKRMARLGFSVGMVDNPLFVPKIKIFCECPEREVKLYAELNNIKFSKKVCPYSADSFRGSVKEAVNLIEKNHTGSKFQMLKSADMLIEILREHFKKEDYLKEEIKKCEICGELTSGRICRMCQVRKMLE